MTAPDADTVDIDEVNTAVQAGETLGVGVAVERAAESDATAETDAALVVGGDEVDTETLEPDPGETETADLEWTAPPNAVGTVEVTVQVGDESTTESVTVEDAPASFAVAIDSVDEFVSAGGRVTVTATIENEGTLDGAQTVEFRVGEETRETRRYSITGQTSETVTFSYEVGENDEPEVTVTVATEDGETEASVPVVAGTVTPLRKLKSKSGMGVFGWLIFLGMLILLVPLLPILALIKLVDVLFGQGSLA